MTQRVEQKTHVGSVGRHGVLKTLDDGLILEEEDGA